MDSPQPPRVAVPPDPRDLPGAFRHRRTIEVRFADTDAMGHVNNATYLTYFEVARASFYLDVTGSMFGIGPASAEASLILAEARVTYRRPSVFGEVLTVESRVASIGRSSFTMEHRITAPHSAFGQSRLVAVASFVLVSYAYDREAVVPVPEELVERFEAWEGRPLRA
ncbi:MAG TPA: thioesterase family protein [Candidatus Limnocylindrales bacterium]|nr:thioesterase family protein [Candidatus Limnocylindrales bacterium]